MDDITSYSLEVASWDAGKAGKAASTEKATKWRTEKGNWKQSRHKNIHEICRQKAPRIHLLVKWLFFPTHAFYNPGGLGFVL